MPSAAADTSAKDDLERLVTERTAALAEANDRLRASEARYRALFDAVDEGFGIIERVATAPGEPVNFRCVAANRVFSRQSGFEDVTGMTMRDVLPGESEAWFDVYDAVLRSGEPIRFERDLETIGQTLEVFAFPFEDPTLMRVGILFQNMTARKQAEQALGESEERQAFLLELSDALKPLANATDIEREATRVLGEALHANRVFYASVEADGDTGVIRSDYVTGIPSGVGSYSLSAFAPTLISEWRAGRTTVASDVDTDPRFTDTQRAAYASVSSRAAIGVPLLKHGRFVALFGVNHATPRVWTDAEIELIQETVERTWAAVERARAEAALRASEERYRMLFETIDQGFCTIEVIFDEDGQPIDYVFLEINSAFARDTGLTDAIGKRMRDLRPGHEQFWFDIYGRVAQTGVGERFEHEARELSRWYSVHAYRVGAPEQRRVAILFEDITERRRAETAMRESRAELERQAQFLDATLSNVGDFISIWDRQARFVYANRALEALWSRKRKAYAGKTTAELGYTPDQAAFFEDAIARVFRTRRVVTGELPYTGPDGVTGYYEIVFSPVTGLGPRPEFVVGVSRDITGRKRREAQAAFLAEVSDDFARLTSPDDIMRVVGEKMYRHFDLTRISFASIDETADTVTSIHDQRAAGLPPAARVIRLSNLISDAHLRRLRTGHVYALHDIDTDPYAAGRVDAFKALGVGALLIAPFVSEGKWRFTITLQKATPYRWPQGEIDLLQDLAPRLYLALERARAGAAIRESEDRFRALANLVPDLLWSTDPDGHPSWYSQRLLDYTGQTQDDLFSSGWLLVIHPADREEASSAFREAHTAGCPYQREHRLRRHDGAYRWFLMRAEPIHDEAGRIAQWFGAATDIHDARLVRDELAERVALATSELRSLSRQLLTVQEEERRHLARELHDEIGQALTALQLQLAAARRTPGRNLPEAETIVHELTGRVSELSMDLRPAALDTLGLVPALLWHSQRYEARAGIRVELRHHGLDRRLPPEIETAAYRVVQEALTNVARHAGVEAVSVQLLADEMLTIVVRDRGQGFDTAATPAAGGLGGMRERVELLEGTLSIEAAAGAGTVVTAEIPLDRLDATKMDDAR